MLLISSGYKFLNVHFPSVNNPVQKIEWPFNSFRSNFFSSNFCPDNYVDIFSATRILYAPSFLFYGTGLNLKSAVCFPQNEKCTIKIPVWFSLRSGSSLEAPFGAFHYICLTFVFECRFLAFIVYHNIVALLIIVSHPSLNILNIHPSIFYHFIALFFFFYTWEFEISSADPTASFWMINPSKSVSGPCSPLLLPGSTFSNTNQLNSKCRLRIFSKMEFIFDPL